MDTTSDERGGERPWQSYRTVYTNAKAGMDKVDKEKVQRTIYEMSKGSKYFEREQLKDTFLRKKIESMRSQCAMFNASDISHFQMAADKKISELEATRDLSKIWLHVDMDAFYAAVETLGNISLKGKPVAVGSMSMICTANYEARKFGVRAAMPGFIAKKLCPNLVFVPTDFNKYSHYSKLTRKVFEKYDPNFIVTSLDEAYLNITYVCKERGVNGGEIAKELRNIIYEVIGLTCSAGVAPNQLLAKVCSDINKPNGQFILPNDRMAIMAFISSLPTRKVGGIGRVTEHVLREVLGISTCEEILQRSAFICALFSACSIDFFLSVGLGLGKTDAPHVMLRKSISSERTFLATKDEAIIMERLADIAEILSNDLQKEGLKGRTLTLKLKTASFEVRTRAISLQKHFNSRRDILTLASKLLKAELPLSLRLIGLRMSQFIDVDPTQRTLANFFCSGAALNSIDGNDFLGSVINDDILEHDKELDPSLDSNSTCLPDNGVCPHCTSYGFAGPSNYSELSGVESKCKSAADTADVNWRSFKISENEEHPVQIDIPHSVAYPAQCETCLQLGLAEDPLELPQASDYDEMNKTNTQTDKVLDISSQEQVLWTDGYICSLCGIELPPCFVKERQEHSDYHLAQMLQKEESVNSKSSSLMRDRFIRKSTHIESSRKKRKSSQCDKYLPIDLFFAKEK